MVASSTINKSLTRKNLSGAEKKKAKLLRECNATLTMLSSEDPLVTQEKAQSTYIFKNYFIEVDLILKYIFGDSKRCFEIDWNF